MAQPDPTEVQRKVTEVAKFLEAHDLDRIVLRRRGPVSWLLDGADSHVQTDTEDGVAIVCVDRDGRITFITNVIESARLIDEELGVLCMDTQFGDNPMQLVFVPWTEDPLDAVLQSAQQCGWREDQIVAESPVANLQVLSGELAERFRSMRYSFSATELARYRKLCSDCALDLEAVTRSIQVGVSEYELAAELSRHVIARGYRPSTVLVAFDARITRYRQPIPTEHTLKRRAMIVLHAEHNGQVMAATRFAGLEPPKPRIAERFELVTEIDARAITRTRPGTAVRDIFQSIVEGYEEAEYPTEWHLNHQGGSIGYEGREYKVNPDSVQVVQANQPFAWNPSITGTKCEDTILTTLDSPEILTHTGNWAYIETEAGPRPVELLIDT